MYMKTCTQPNCDRVYYAKNLCEAHYSRKRNGRNMEKPVVIVGNDLDRFMSHVEKTSDCWLWVGAQKGRGYGKFHLKGTASGVSAHRFAYEYFKKKISPQMQIDHLCRVKLCVNPEHLEEVTNRENTLRAVRARMVS